MSAQGDGEPPDERPPSTNTAILVTTSTTIPSPTLSASVSAVAATGLTKAEQTGIGIGATFAGVLAIGLGLFLWTRCTRKSVSSKEDGKGQEKGLLGASKPRKRISPSFDVWLWELVALLIGIAAFIAIVIVLKVNEHQDLYRWTLPISLNTIISILAALFKAILALPITEGISQLKWSWFHSRPRSLADIELFDQASRGPWGSVKLIGSQFVRRQRSYSATLGAMLLIMLLAVDPFSQATLQYYSCRRPESGLTMIPSGNAYRPTSATNRDGTVIILDPGMEKAIYTGLFKPPANSSQSVDVACATGNCTFPSEQGATFNTLGLCHKCIDQSALVLASPGNPWILPTDSTGNPDENNVESPDPYLQGPQLGDFTQFNTTAGSNQTLPDWPWNTTTLMGFRGLARKYDPYCNWNSDTGSYEDSPLCDGSQWIAFDCAFQACVKTFGANVSDGVYIEQEISRQPLHIIRDPGHLYPGPDLAPIKGYTNYALWEVGLNRTLVNGTWQDCTPSRNSSAIHNIPVLSPESQDYDWYNLGQENAPKSWYRRECVYNITGLTDTYFNEIFNNQSLYSDTDPRFTQGTSWMKGVFNQGNITLSGVDAFAAGLATSMEAYIRENPTGTWPGRLDVVGQTWANDSCIRVRWGFLSWLAILLALELIFFGRLLMSVLTGPPNVGWKSSSLALLFHGLAGAPLLEKRTPTNEEMVDIAKSTKVSLMNMSGSYKFVEQ